MGIDSAKLINLAAHGVRPTQIAAAIGVSPGRLTQILDNEKIIELVEVRKSELASKEIDAITSIESINDQLLGKIGALVDETESLSEAVRAYETLEKMQAVKKGNGAATAEEGITNIIVQVPIFVQQALEIQTNRANEIIAVDDRSMAAMPTQQVQVLIDRSARDAARKRQDEDNLRQSKNCGRLAHVDIPPYEANKDPG